MPISISNQAYIFICSVFGGVLIAFLYDCLRIKRKMIKTSNLIIHIEDFFYWIIVALVMFGVVYYSNDGELRGYIFLGTALGAILYILLFSRIVMCISLAVLRTAYRIIRIIWRIVSYPVIIILKILWFPTRRILKLANKGLKVTRRTAKHRISRAALWGRVLKNMIKKI